MDGLRFMMKNPIKKDENWGTPISGNHQIEFRMTENMSEYMPERM